MFPDMEAEVIEEVLSANSGAVDTTIDQLLAMMNDNKQPEDVLAMTNDNNQPEDVEASTVVRYKKHQSKFTNS